MATMSNAGGTVTYSYNALEMRVGKTGPTALVPTGAAYYVYDEEGKLLGEYDANGVPIYETIYLGAPVGVVKQTGTAGASNIAISLYNVSTDQIGAPRVITRQSDEAIVWRWDSAEAFGATAPDQNPSSLGTFSFNQRFPGQVFDAESGLFQNWNREYNPRIGRYMQSDPIGLKGGINTYGYVDGNPNSFTDPSGLVPAAAGLLCLVPGVGWVSCATVATGAVVVGGTYLLIRNYGPAIASATSQACEATYNGIRNWMTSEKADGGNKFPDRPLPRDKHGNPIPYPEASGPHTQLGQKDGRNGKYDQAREFDANGKPVRDIDFTDHGRPGNHPSPHQHDYLPNPTGGTPQRGPTQPLR
jgi:RHS repeat-associated protein